MAGKNYINAGKVLPFVATAALVGGQLFKLGNMILINDHTVKVGEAGEAHTCGHWKVDKPAIAVDVGAPVYWNTSTKAIVAAAGADIVQIGFYTEAATTGDATANILLSV